MGTRAGLSRKWHFSWEWTTRSWQCEDLGGEYLKGNSLKRESLRNTKWGWTGWSIMEEAENVWNEIRDGAIMQVLRGHGREVFSCYGKPVENFKRGSGMVYFFRSTWLLGRKLVTVGTVEGKDSERWGVGTHRADQSQTWGMREESAKPSPHFRAYQSQMKGGGFRWSSQASVLDSVTMAGGTCLGNINEQA